MEPEDSLLCTDTTLGKVYHMAISNSIIVITVLILVLSDTFCGPAKNCICFITLLLLQLVTGLLVSKPTP